MSDTGELVLRENNDETVALTVTRLYLADDLMAVTEVQLVLKDSDCDVDADGLVLSSLVATELVIVSRTSALITAEAYVPASALAGAWPRFYHVDVLTTDGKRRTARSGPVRVVNL